jgi:uncharacterized protein (TIGR02453 family)
MPKIDNSGFSGFSKETLDFLFQVHERNSKAWFEEHREDYERHLLHPMRALAAELSGVITTIDPLLETDPLRVVSRIHRDIRFSRDKSFYKRAMWLTFKRRVEGWQDSPAFYFEVSPDGYRFGMGFYAVSRETMDLLRQCIEKKPTLIKKHLAAIGAIPGMTLAGEAYKRVINPAIPVELQTLYQKKELYLVITRSIDDTLFGKGIVTDLENCFGKLAGFYHFLLALKSK